MIDAVTGTVFGLVQKQVQRAVLCPVLPDQGRIISALEPRLTQQADDLEEAYRAKAASIAIPVLVIHGDMDALAPLDDAEEMFRNFASTGKKMLVIPGAGHNDLLFKGLDEYFTAIGDFIFG